MKRTQWLDPIGPGSSAWYHFDLALEAYRATPKGQRHNANYHYHRYSNQREDMVLALKKAGASESLVIEWCESLRQQCKLGEP